MNTSLPSSRRALVLGGGGSAGNAWLIGVAAGLAEAGLDVTTADLIIGTSAGATAAAQLTAATASDLLTQTLNAVIPQRPGGAGPMLDHLERTNRVIAESTGIADMRRRAGASALELEASTDPVVQERWRATVAARLPSQSWPNHRVQLTAVDARTGEPVIFDRDSGVALADAVAASCAGGFAYAIGGIHYIDGGYRTNADNADLAAGHERVLVLSPLGGRSRHPRHWGTHLAEQVDALRAEGSAVETIFPDEVALAAFGDNLMDLSARAPAARAGHAQGLAIAGRLEEFWG